MNEYYLLDSCILCLNEGKHHAIAKACCLANKWAKM